MEIQFNSDTIRFAEWHPGNGNVFTRPIALDTETTMIHKAQPASIPDYVYSAASDGQVGYFLTPDNVLSFIRAHQEQILVMHNAPFDLKVLQKLADQQNAGLDLYQRVERNQVYDTQLLHRLYILATEGHTASKKGQSTLETCCERYLNIELPKDVLDSRGNSIRLSWKQYLGADCGQIEPVYLDYLAKDVLATIGVYSALSQKLAEVLHDNSGTWGFVSDGWLAQQIEQWGPQTHHIQLKGAIALEAISRLGIGIDVQARDERLKELEELIRDKKASLRRHGFASGLGSAGVLQARIKKMHDADPHLRLERTSTGKYKTDEDALDRLATFAAFFADLAVCKAADKLRSTYLDKMSTTRIHPSYDTLKNTGRTSSHGAINIQNLPRDNGKNGAGVRRCFVPADGHVFYDCDYKTIELVTLAQSVLGLGEPSRMAEAINAGQDLHRLVAGQATGKPSETVTPDERQAAKALNFGLPGGLGVKTLQSYAATTFHVQLDDQQAEPWRQKWFDTFPEMRTFLDGGSIDTNQIIAEFFGLIPSEYKTARGWQSCYTDPADDEPQGWLGGMLVKTLSSDQPATQAGRLYNPDEIGFFWQKAVARLDHLPKKLRALLQKGKPDPQIGKLLHAHFGKDGVFTLTGRLRAGASYCARHNTMFQGLAADGAKLALWNLWRSGYRVVAFVHDQVLVEVPAAGDLAAVAEDIKALMVVGMKEVAPDVAVNLDGDHRTRWSKSDKLLVPVKQADSDAAEIPLAMAA